MQRHSAAFSVSHHSEKDFASNSYWHSLYDDIGFVDHPSSFEAASSGGERGYLTRALWERLAYPSSLREVRSGGEKNKSTEKGPKLRVLPDQSVQRRNVLYNPINVQNGINVQ